MQVGECGSHLRVGVTRMLNKMCNQLDTLLEGERHTLALVVASGRVHVHYTRCMCMWRMSASTVPRMCCVSLRYMKRPYQCLHVSDTLVVVSSRQVKIASGESIIPACSSHCHLPCSCCRFNRGVALCRCILNRGYTVLCLLACLCHCSRYTGSRFNTTLCPGSTLSSCPAE